MVYAGKRWVKNFVVKTILVPQIIILTHQLNSRLLILYNLGYFWLRDFHYMSKYESFKVNTMLLFSKTFEWKSLRIFFCPKIFFRRTMYDTEMIHKHFVLD